MCAWRCGSSSNSGLVSNLVTAGIISSERVQRAMLAVDRGNYTLVDPYADSPQGIGHGATISAPQ